MFKITGVTGAGGPEQVAEVAGRAGFGLKNLKIGAKIALGSGAILLFLVIVSATGFLSLEMAVKDFANYRQTARESNQLGRIQANLLEARLAVKDFLIENSEQAADRVHTRIDTLITLVEEADLLFTDQAKIAVVDEVKAEMQAYEEGFDRVIEQFGQRNALVARMNVLGPKAREELSEVMESAFRDGDAQASFYAGLTLQHLLLARLYAFRFLIENTAESSEQALQEMSKFEEEAGRMLRELENPQRRSLAQSVLSGAQDYRSTFAEVVEVINSRNAIIKGTLDQIGPRVAASTEELKLANKKYQDEIGPEATAAMKRAVWITLVVALVAIIVGIVLAMFIGRAISRPISAMTTAMTSLAEGDRSVDIPGTNQGDEIGDMAQAVLVFKENMVKNHELQAAAAREQEERNKRAETVDVLTKTFDEKATEMLRVVATAASDMNQTATNLSSAAEESSTQAASVAAASTQAANNVQTVAASAEQLTASISEISQQVTQSSQLASTTAEEAQGNRDLVQKLVDSASRIGEVVKLITDIAEQTNLLALNATIEAARAGEAGKGFAVVASEVKALANQTAKATEEIRTQIEAIQGDTATTADSIEGIGKRIEEISQISSTIAAAIEEQNAATQEISRNVNQAASSTQEVTNNIEGVNQAAQTTSASSTQLLQASSDLSTRSEDLSEMVQTFLAEVRAA